jgi:hypothetical protein
VRTTTRLVDGVGKIGYAGYQIGVGQPLARQRVTITDDGDKITVTDPAGEIVNLFAADDPRTYIGTGRPRGRPPASH